ncbi:MAG: DUF1801 domain-containing protein [Deltaproteobacteria bacterium]|nr:DUF1801 domain-containing protein [Deltaproteobacteria bacterium]
MSPTKRANKKPTTFTAEERAAMKERARELKAGDVDGTKAVLEKIASLPEPDRSMARRIHAIVLSAAPSLTPRLWYGMPAYARDEKTICLFQSGQKFKTRYATLGFSDKAKLDDGEMWPNAYALTKLTPDVEAKIAALVKKAVG